LSDQRLPASDIVAQREYFVKDATPPMVITARIGMPRKRADGRYECGAELQEPAMTTLRYMNGVDAFEAIQLALVVLGVDLKHINEQLDGALCWQQSNQGVGLPSYPDFSLSEMLGASFKFQGT